MSPRSSYELPFNANSLNSFTYMIISILATYASPINLLAEVFGDDKKNSCKKILQT